MAVKDWIKIDRETLKEMQRISKTQDTTVVLRKAKANLEENIEDKVSPAKMRNVNLGILNTLLGDIAVSLALIADSLQDLKR
jgi:capsular polysaccharide biosynthesis protein